MIECVAVLGRMIIDRAFHQALFAVANDGKEYKDLKDLDSFLNDTHGLRLCRWEVMTVNTLVRQEILYIVDANHNVVERRVQHLIDAKDDGVVNNMQNAWTALPSPMAVDFSSRESIEFCAALGLACIDHVFAASLVAASDPDSAKTTALQTLLTTKNPRFNVPADLTSLNRFLQINAVVNDMKAFHAERWVQPGEPCDLGYTHDQTRKYNFLTQTETQLLFKTNASIKNAFIQLRERDKGQFAPAL
jgi:hypothetical protein